MMVADLAGMARYFFDFRSAGATSIDEEGEALTDMSAAHRVAVDALADAIRDLIIEGSNDQQLAVEVRDEVGPVLQVSAVLQSRIFRKQ